MKNLVFHFDFLFAILTAGAAAAFRDSQGSLVENWLYTSQLDSQALRLLDRPDILGVQVLYTWKSLEPQEDQYNFSAIERDLDLVQSKGKQLWVQLQDRTFSFQNNPVPNYLHTSVYNNGSVPEYNGTKKKGWGPPFGWVAAHWNKNVRGRFQSLLKALASSFDGRIYGINLAETSIGNINDDCYTDQGYFKGELENAKYAASVFHKSYAVQYVNFWNGAPNNTYMADSFAFFAKHGVGIGGPDDLPYKPYQEANSYPYFKQYSGKVPIAVIAVQEPDLEYICPNTSVPCTKKEFTDFAVNQLDAKIMFWALSSPWLQNYTQGYKGST